MPPGPRKPSSEPQERAPIPPPRKSPIPQNLKNPPTNLKCAKKSLKCPKTSAPIPPGYLKNGRSDRVPGPRGLATPSLRAARGGGRRRVARRTSTVGPPPKKMTSRSPSALLPHFWGTKRDKKGKKCISCSNLSTGRPRHGGQWMALVTFWGWEI